VCDTYQRNHLCLFTYHIETSCCVPVTIHNKYTSDLCVLTVSCGMSSGQGHKRRELREPNEGCLFCFILVKSYLWELGQQRCHRCKEALINFQVCSSRDAVQKEGVVISFMSSVILEMHLLMQIMIVGIRGGSDNMVLSYDPDQGQDRAHAVPLGEGHSGQWLLAVRS